MREIVIRSAWYVVRSVLRDLRTTHYALRKKIFLFSASILLLLITACSGNANAESQPPQIHYGEDVCEFCGMIVTEERFAAGYITAGGQEHIFDDIGDMLQSRLQESENVQAIFVHDYDEHTWIKAESAYYALSENLPTPMLSGLAAFVSLERANEFAAELNGRVFTFDELLTYYRENPPTPVLPGD